MKLKYLAHPGILVLVAVSAFAIVAYVKEHKETKIKSPMAYDQYITAYTAGEISRNSRIRVQFVDEMVRPGEVHRGISYLIRINYDYFLNDGERGKLANSFINDYF